jgi:hypothetical protein
MSGACLTRRCTVFFGATPASSSWNVATSERLILPVLNAGYDGVSVPLCGFKVTGRSALLHTRADGTHSGRRACAVVGGCRVACQHRHTVVRGHGGVSRRRRGRGDGAPLGARDNDALGLADDGSGVLHKVRVLLHRRHLHGPIQRVAEQLGAARRWRQRAASHLARPLSLTTSP